MNKVLVSSTCICKRNKLYCFISLLFLSICLATTSGELFANNDDKEIQTIRRTIQNFRSEHGTAISLEDYNELVYNRPNPIEWRFSRDLWSELKVSQNPGILLKDLKKIIKSKQDSLTRLRCKYIAHRSSPNKSISPSEIETVTEFIKYNKLLFKSVKKRDLSTDQIILRNTASYDGDVLRSLDYPLDSDLENSLPDASISEFTDRSSFFDADNMLVQSLLLTSQDAEEGGCPIYNLSSFLDSDGVILFENHVAVDGFDCLLITDGVFLIYLSVEMDYTPVRIDTYLSDPRKDREHMYQRVLYSSCSHKNFKKFQNSIWFPEFVETKVTHPGQLFEFFDKITYTDVSLDFDMNTAFFQDIIPDGSLVVDGVRGMVYRWGDHPSIGSLIKETVKSKRQAIFRNLSVVCGLCFLACWGFIEWRKRRLLKENTE